jgi:hypothetical protein
MAQSIEPVESLNAVWVTRLIVTSVVIGLLTLMMGLSEGTTAKALPFAILSLGLAITARIVAQVTDAHRAGATVAIVVGAVVLCSGLQSALIGTGLVQA